MYKSFIKVNTVGTGSVGEDNSLAAVSAIADYQMHIAGLRGDVRLIKWIVGFNLAFSVTVLMLIVRLLAASTA